MEPGPVEYIRCYRCGNTIYRQTYNSWNTFFATYYTDCRIIAPMMPRDKLLMKCPFCKKAVWLEEMEIIGVDYPFSVNRNGQKAREFELLNFEEYLAFLGEDDFTAEEEKYLRINIWQSGNDKRRDSENPEPLSEIETENMLRLIALLDDSDDQDKLMKVEVLRELGKFEEAEELINTIKNPELDKIVDFILELIKRRDVYVRRVENEKS